MLGDVRSKGVGGGKALQGQRGWAHQDPYLDCGVLLEEEEEEEEEGVNNSPPVIKKRVCLLYE